MNIKTVPIAQVDVWKDNPRNIKTTDFERLKRQIKELGVYKPLICVLENGSYITLGGNMRLLALRALGHKEIDISVVEAKSQAMRIKYALSDNDRAGEYDEQAAAEWVYPHIKDINLEDYKMDLGVAINLKTLVSGFGPDIDFADLDKELSDLEGMELVDIVIALPKKYAEKVTIWLANGEERIATGLGKGVLKRCKLL